MRPLSALVVAFALGCGSSPPPDPEPPRAVRPPVGVLTTLVPPDAQLLVIASPEALLAAAPTERVLRAVLPDDQLDRFAARTGVDLRALTELVVAAYTDGRVALARGPFDATLAVREAGERMAPVEASVDEPVVRRVGFLGRGRVDASALAEDTILHVDGSPQLAADVLAAAARVAAERDDALERCPLGDHAGAPLVLCAPRPLGLPADTGIGMLLAREETLIVSVRPDAEQLRLTAEMWGEFPPGVEDNLRAFAESVAQSELGAVLGIPDALPSLSIEAGSGHVTATAELDPGLLARGLRALLVAEIEELLEGPANSRGN